MVRQHARHGLGACGRPVSANTNCALHLTVSTHYNLQMKFYPIRLLVLIISSSLFSASCKSKNEYFSKALETLEILDQNSEPDFKTAITYLEKSIELDSTFVNAYYWKSHCEMKLKYYQKTIETSTTGLKHIRKFEDKLVAPLYINQGLAFLKLQNQEAANASFSQAIEVYDYILEHDETNMDAISNKSLALCYANKKEEALKFINDLIKVRQEEVLLQDLHEEIESFDMEDFLNQL
jgi:tetratricopeptide (TPR) repeat protein